MAYVIGPVLMGIFAVMARQCETDRGVTAGIWVSLVINTLLFPFSKLVRDALKRFLMGDTVILMNGSFLFRQAHHQYGAVVDGMSRGTIGSCLFVPSQP